MLHDVNADIPRATAENGGKGGATDIERENERVVMDKEKQYGKFHGEKNELKTMSKVLICCFILSAFHDWLHVGLSLKVGI